MFNALGSAPGVVTWGFVFFLVVLLPITALRQHYALKAGTMHAPPRMLLYASALATHAMLLLGVLAVSLADDFWLFPPFSVNAVSLVASAIALGLGLLLLMERFNASDEVARARTRMIAPRTPRELAAFCGIAVSAGFAEQLAYRGVLFSFFYWYTGWMIVAAVLAAIAFGLVHLFQGWRSARIVMIVGLRDQLLVALTGTLVYAIAIHIIHDVIAGMVLMRRARREDPPSGVS